MIKLGVIPEDKYSSYRYNIIFKAYKWDPQVEDHNTISKYVVLIDQELANQLEEWAEELSSEVIEMENKLKTNLDLAKNLGFPRKINKALKRLKNYDANRNVRLMRFDFHPTIDGWQVSEVNSDVPGGLAEASLMPKLASDFFKNYEVRNNIAERLYLAFKEKVGSTGRIAFVYATSYSDDRQVMQFISDYFNQKGLSSIIIGPDHIKWEDNKAYCIIEGFEGEIDGIVRFYPLEWLTNLSKDSKWEGYFDTITPSCNHPIAIFAQSKRLPLIWERLDIDIKAWKKLLPETVDPKTIKEAGNEWIFKPALGRVGEGISIKEAISNKEFLKIQKAAKKEPKYWVGQKKFISKPLIAPNGESYHLCIGVFTVDGKRAGFYGRISPYPRIDGNAKDIPILVLKEGVNDEE